MTRAWGLAMICVVVAASCSDEDATAPPTSATPTTSAAVAAASSSAPARREHVGAAPVSVGEPIELAELNGRIVFDDFEDVYAMRPDGTDVVGLAVQPGAEFDGAWSPDGRFVVYRDSRRGINDDDEIFVVGADGSGPRNVTNNPANDWGPAWSPDGQWIAFNSDRDDGALRGYLVRPDGSDLTPLPIDQWFEYPAFSPDGTRIAFMSHSGGNYDIFVADLATGAATRLTDASGSDGWPAWSPDGTTIAFASERDDCARVLAEQECWRGDVPGEHHDIWIMDADGGNQRRVTAESGQFVTWSPDGRFLLISGRALYVVRPDGTGRLELRADGIPRALGGIPDWTD